MALATCKTYYTESAQTVSLFAERSYTVMVTLSCQTICTSDPFS